MSLHMSMLNSIARVLTQGAAQLYGIASSCLRSWHPQLTVACAGIWMATRTGMKTAQN